MYRLEIEALDLGADVRAVALELTEADENREPVRGADAARIWARLLQATAGTEPWAKNQVNLELVEEADVICVMEEAHRRHIRDRFGDAHAEKVVVLDVPDNYVCWEAKLIDLLKGKLRTALGLKRTV